MSDIQLIANNCEQYNGAESELTKDARVLVDFTRKALDEVIFVQSLELNRCSEGIQLKWSSTNACSRAYFQSLFHL